MIGTQIIEGQYAYATDRDDAAMLRRVARRARRLAGKGTEHGKFAEARYLRAIADRADQDRFRLKEES